eukprot:14338240-Ditylum_brightwellii.AAC.1
MLVLQISQNKVKESLQKLVERPQPQCCCCKYMYGRKQGNRSKLENYDSIVTQQEAENCCGSALKRHCGLFG